MTSALNTKFVGFSCGYKEPPVYDMGQKAREILTSRTWTPVESKEYPLPQVIYKEILEKAGLTGFDEVDEDPVPTIRLVGFSESEGKDDVYEELTYNVENLVYSAAKQGHKNRCIKVVGKLSDGDEKRLKDFFKIRGLFFNVEWAGNCGNSRYELMVNWEKAL